MSRNFADYEDRLANHTSESSAFAVESALGESSAYAFSPASASFSPRARLLEFVGLIREGQFDTLADYLTDDFEMDIHEVGARSETLFAGSCQGKAAGLATIRRNFESTSDQYPQILEIIDDGPNIAILMEESGLFLPTGKRYAFRVMAWFQFEEGLLRKFEEVLIPLPVLPESDRSNP